eukprot:jgi/Ulvmu1/6959/UM033_0016.1
MSNEPHNNRHTVVCDVGSSTLKAGFPGSAYPGALVPCLVQKSTTADQASGQPRSVYKPIREYDWSNQQHHAGDLFNPCANGKVEDWDAMHCLWQCAFDELQVDPTDSRILLTDPPLNPAKNREQLVTAMFEDFRFSQLMVQPQAVLALYSQGRTTGLVVDSGAAVTHIVPVCDGHSDPHHIKRLNVAGDHVTQRLADLLHMRGYAVGAAHTASGALQRLKERCCYVAVDYGKEIALAQQTTCLAATYDLPDGQRVRIAAERFQAAEVLFQPSMLGFEAAGLSHAVHACIAALPIDIRRKMYKYVLLGGGTMMLPGLSTRLQSDLQELHLEHVLGGNSAGLDKFRIGVDEPPLRRHMVYSGACILAGIYADYPSYWISRAEYEEDPNRALQRCSAQSHSSSKKGGQH